jgi:hypothetical protein
MIKKGRESVTRGRDVNEAYMVWSANSNISKKKRLPPDYLPRHFRFFSVRFIRSLTIKNSKAIKTSVYGLSEMCIQLRPQILSLLSIETPVIFNHTADTKKKRMQKLRTYLTTFMILLSGQYDRFSPCIQPGSASLLIKDTGGRQPLL